MAFVEKGSIYMRVWPAWDQAKARKRQRLTVSGGVSTGERHPCLAHLDYGGPGEKNEWGLSWLPDAPDTS